VRSEDGARALASWTRSFTRRRIREGETLSAGRGVGEGVNYKTARTTRGDARAAATLAREAYGIAANNDAILLYLRYAAMRA